MAQLINVIERRKGLAKYKDGEDYLLCLSHLTIVMRDDEGRIQTFPCTYSNIEDLTDDEIFDCVKENQPVSFISLKDLTNDVQRNFELRNDDALSSLCSVLYDMAVATLPFTIDEDLRKYLTRMKKFIDKILTKNEIITDTWGVE